MDRGSAWRIHSGYIWGKIDGFTESGVPFGIPDDDGEEIDMDKNNHDYEDEELPF